MSYQRECEEYALYGNPERDHWDYECNAQYDRYDGWADEDPQYSEEYMRDEAHWFDFVENAHYNDGGDWVLASAADFFEDCENDVA